MNVIRLTIFGGSFNPPHVGHLLLGEEVVTQLGYDTLLFVPVWKNPFKAEPSGATEVDRVEMLKRAIAAVGNNHLDIELCEIKRRGISYTADTVACLAQKYAGRLDGKIGLVIGDDLSCDFHKWHKYRELLALSEVIVARRVLEPTEGAFPFPYIELQNALLPISSSDIRRRIASGGAWRALVVPSVAEYIMQKKLYGYTP
ncbi:nicotinate (nicotinamide) nucleotide adenylyltransferase [Treponema endosymbiont of Eucomonympha sp.]|uniref:nicotinate (nicotinamide) nucleotide adenylyltransferase n=1 Tax=Treponema endosymbiont of Eucomonympha sp. TaxID=1580831 RepID=UPI000AC66F63|nr:nicotinate (nicotinamide) nucleotide adenylyltransferase [Treponema endosymbiont of Eucomonympha sp.]